MKNLNIGAFMTFIVWPVVVVVAIFNTVFSCFSSKAIEQSLSALFAYICLFVAIAGISVLLSD